MKNKCIVYALVCLLLLQAYVGSTTDSERRFKEHLSRLRRGNHDNKVLQDAFDEYGEEYFEFISLEVVESIDALPAREKAWILELRQVGAAINKTLSGTPGMRGKKLSAETRQKQSLAKKQNPSDNRKDYAFLAPDGTLHRPHGLREFCNQFGLSISGMSRLCGNKQKSSKGWRRAEGNV